MLSLPKSSTQTSLHSDCCRESCTELQGKPDEKWLDDVTVDEAKQYVEEGHFAPGSMLPKVQAALDFAESKPGRQSLITLLEKAKDGILGETGTRIHL